MKKIKILHTKESCSAYGADEQIRVLCNYLKDDYDIYRASPLGECIKNSKGIYKDFYEVSFVSSFDVGSIFKLSKIMKKEKFDIVHGHSSRSDWITFLAWILSGYYKTKLMTTIHAENDVVIKKVKVSLKTKIALGLRPWIVKKFFSKVTTVSKAIKDIMISELGFSNRQVIHTINGNDLNRIQNINKNFNLREELAIVQKYIVITSGRVRKPLGESKGYLDFINAIEILSKKRDDIYFIALGGGEDFDNLQLFVNEKGFNNFTLLGHKDNPLDYIVQADIFTLLSHQNVEGMPRALMESMGLGMPCIGSDVGGINEIILDGENGFIVDEKSPEQVANKIEELIEDAVIRERFSKNAKKLIFDTYSNDNMAQAYKKVYQEVLVC